MRNVLLMGIGILANSIKGDVKMTNATAQEPVNSVQGIEEVLWCPESKSAIFGTHLVSQKLLNLIRLMLLTEEDHGINVIRFTEDLPKVAVVNEQDEMTGEFEDAMADYDFEGRCVVINVKCHLLTAMKRIVESSKMMRIGAYIHANLIISILHELFESHKFIDAENPYLIDPASNDDECERMAKDLLIEYARTTDIEPPHISEESDIIRMFIEEFEADAETSPDEWAKEYTRLMEKNLTYVDGETEIATLRTYYKRYAEAGEGASEWPEEVTTVTMVAFNQTSEAVIKADDNTPADVPAVAPVSEPASSDVNIPVVNPQTPAVQPAVDDYNQPFDYDNANVDGIPSVDMPTQTPVNQAPVVNQLPAQQNQGSVPSEPVMPQPVGLPASQTAPAQTQPVATLPVHNLSVDQKLTFIKDMCLRMYDYIFGYCGFNPNPMAQPADPHMGFTNPMAVYGFVPVTDIPFAKEILVGVKTIDETSGQEITVDIWNPQVAGWPAGHIRGLLWDKGQYTSQCHLPGYKLILNLDGIQSMRTFAPQNVNKMTVDKSDPTGQRKILGKWAMEGRQGTMRAILLDDNRHQNDKVALTVTTTTDGTKVREVMLNPFNPSTRKILT